jgi:hypothetical protein
MPSELKRLNRLLICGLLLMAAGLGLSMSLSGLRPDMLYDPDIGKHLFIRSRPTFIVDEGHWNRYTASALLAPLVKMASRDGFRVERHRSRFSEGSLEGVRILVVAGARSMPASLEVVARRAGVRTNAAAFNRSEVEAVREWVGNGGGLLLAVGDEISARQSVPLLEGLGMRLTSAAGPGPRVYERRNDTLLPHPVTDGRKYEETALRVFTYGGPEFAPPQGVRPFLEPGVGRAQGVAFELGKGRVAVFADPICLTALRRSAEHNSDRFGMSAPGAYNTDLAINTLRWLARAF